MIKKIILLFFGLSLADSSLAEVMIINNTNNDLEVKYNICYGKECDPQENITIKPKVRADDVNYQIIFNKQCQACVFKILSAVEKDQSGKIVAQSDFHTDNMCSSCSEGLAIFGHGHGGDSYLNIAIELNNMNHSPVIMCHHNVYSRVPMVVGRSTL